jgi:hypothetical protein
MLGRDTLPKRVVGGAVRYWRLEYRNVSTLTCA